jgi:hypothetical protein
MTKSDQEIVFDEKIENVYTSSPCPEHKNITGRIADQIQKTPLF